MAFILGIIAIICSALSAFVPGLGLLMWPGLILGIIAVVMGTKALKMDPSDGKSKIGRILGIIAIALFVISIILGVVLAGLLISALM